MADTPEIAISRRQEEIKIPASGPAPGARLPRGEDVPSVKSSKSVLDERALAQVLQSKYRLPEELSVTLYRISGSDVYRVTDGREKWFLKVYRHTKRDTRRAAAAIRALALLSAQDFPVPQPVRTREDELAFVVKAGEGPRLAYLSPAIRGQEPQEMNEQHGYLYGVTAATMHQLMDGLAPPAALPQIGYAYLFERYLQGIEHFLPQERTAIAFLRRLARALWRELEETIEKERPEFGFCHGDMHRGNAVLTDSGDLYLLDFDACGLGWRVLDIGTYYVSYDWMGLDDESRRKRRQVQADFLRGYESIKPVTEAERRTLPLFMAIRHFELLGIGIGRVSFTGSHWVNERQFKADVAWFRQWLEAYDGLTL